MTDVLAKAIVRAELVLPDKTNPKYTLLDLDEMPELGIGYRKYRIDGVEYEPVIVYDLPNNIGIKAQGGFVGKIVEFIE